MEWLARFRGQVIALDTAPVIYFIESRSPFAAIVRPFFQALDAGEFTAVTSVLTVIEVLVHPFRAGDAALAESYRSILLKARNLTTYSLTADVAEEAARIRAMYNLSTPDAIQVATAIHCNAGILFTNDRSFSTIPELTVVTLDSLIAGS